MRKGQVTLFLIIGIAIVIGLGYAMYNSSVSKQAKVTVETEKLSTLKLQINPLTNFMSHCANDVLKDTLEMSGLNSQRIADQVQSQIQNLCDLQSFEERGIEITTEIPEIQIEIKHGELIILRLTYPLTLKSEEETLTLKDFATSLSLITQQPILYDPAHPGQTQETTRILSSDEKMSIEIAPGTQFFDGAGNVVTPATVGITIQDNPQVPSDPGDSPSQISYQLQLYDANGGLLAAVEAVNANDPSPVQLTYYGDSAGAASYAFNSDPPDPHWEAIPSSTRTQEIRVLSFKQEQEVDELAQQILSSPEVQGMDAAHRSSVQQGLADLHNPQRDVQEQSLSLLETQIPPSLSRRLNTLQNILETAPINLQTITTTEISDLERSHHLKKSTSLPERTPERRTDTETAKTQVSATAHS